MRSLIITIFIFALIAQQQVQATSRIDTTQAQDAWGTFNQSWPTKYWDQFYTCRDKCQVDYQCGSGTQCELDMIGNQAAQILETEENCPTYSELLTKSDADFKQCHENFRDWGNCLWQLGSSDHKAVSPLGNSYYLCASDCVFEQKELFEEENQELIKEWYGPGCEGRIDTTQAQDAWGTFEQSWPTKYWDQFYTCRDKCQVENQCGSGTQCETDMIANEAAWILDTGDSCEWYTENLAYSDADFKQCHENFSDWGRCLEDLSSSYFMGTHKYYNCASDCVFEQKELFEEENQELIKEWYGPGCRGNDREEDDEDDEDDYQVVMECLGDCWESNCPDYDCVQGDERQTLDDEFNNNESCKSFMEEQEEIDDVYKEIKDCFQHLVEVFEGKDYVIGYFECAYKCADNIYASSMTFALVSFLVALFIAC